MNSIYKFFDKDNKEITDITVKGLATADYYILDNKKYPIGGRIFFINNEAVEGIDDKFYVYDTTVGLVKNLEWGNYGVVVDACTDFIGSGKHHSKVCLENPASYITHVDNRGILEPTITIWQWLRDEMNAKNIGGCNDWYIPSMTEQALHKNSGLTNYYSESIWLSECSTFEPACSAFYWYSRDKFWRNWTKNGRYAVFAIRSF